MSILVDKNTRLIVQGITGREGPFHTGQMLAYGTKVVAGVTPGKGGQEVTACPSSTRSREAVEATGANASIIFVPPAFAAEAMLEAADNGIELIVCITEGIPVQDMIETVQYVQQRGVRLIGPNCPGLITAGPGAGRHHARPHLQAGARGPGVPQRHADVRSGRRLTGRGIGQSTCVGIGGDPIIGTRFIDVLQMFEEDPQTEVVVMIGEIGGSDEEEAAEYIKADEDARRQLHLRPHRAARQAHGPRGRHHLRRPGHRAVESGRAGGGRRAGGQHHQRNRGRSGRAFAERKSSKEDPDPGADGPALDARLMQRRGDAARSSSIVRPRRLSSGLTRAERMRHSKASPPDRRRLDAGEVAGRPVYRRGAT